MWCVCVCVGVGVGVGVGGCVRACVRACVCGVYVACMFHTWVCCVPSEVCMLEQDDRKRECVLESGGGRGMADLMASPSLQ